MASYLGPLLSSLEAHFYSSIDHGLIPDFLLRPAIRSLCRLRLREIAKESVTDSTEGKWEFVESLKGKPVAIDQDKANEQHYEVSTAFIQSCLGPHMKYSCCLYPTGKETLEEAEVLMLEDYCRKAKLEDGQDVLDLGCGWGSLCLYVAQKYPRSRVTALSNSSTQKLYIDSCARDRGLNNLQVITGDVMVYDFKGEKEFDRILSIEMLEHMKNYEFLFSKISTWLRPTGLFFAHIFCHRTSPYHFTPSDGWMALHFFSGGTMPSLDLFNYFQRDLVLQRSWYLSGQHYAKTLEAWLKKVDTERERWVGKGKAGAVEGKEGAEKRKQSALTYYRFRVFFMACAEFFNLDGGQQWGVGHYLFTKR